MSRFLMDRGIFDNEIWADIPCFRLFFLLVGKAAYQDGQKIGGIELKRGQYIRSYRKLQEDLAYSEDNTLKEYSTRTIKRCIDLLVAKERLTVEECSFGTVFTLVNYETYQCFGTSENANPETPAKHQRNTSETIRTNKTNLTNKTPLPPKGGGDGFLKFWEVYPKKQDKVRSEAIWRRKKLEAIAPRIIESVQRFKQTPQWLNENGRFIPKPNTFLNGQNWDDEIAAVSNEPKSQTRKAVMLDAWRAGKSFKHKPSGKTVTSKAIRPYNPDNPLDKRVTEDNPTTFQSIETGNFAYFSDFEVID